MDTSKLVLSSWVGLGVLTFFFFEFRVAFPNVALNVFPVFSSAPKRSSISEYV